MMAASKKVAKLVRQENREQRKSKRNARCEAGGIFVKERERAQPFVDRGSLILGKGAGELRARREASTQREEKEHASDDQTPPRAAIRGRLFWRGGQIDAPSRFGWRDKLGFSWKRWCHEPECALQCPLDQYTTVLRR